ncbi:MAG: cytochrome c [Chloroflexi bacterium]|nr:cytochrome c [Chloroflexota bacterium]
MQLALVLGVSAGFSLVCFLRQNAPERYRDPAQHFEYGSIGADSQGNSNDPDGGGVPYAIWRVLPTVFSDKLPNRPGVGYARFGFIYETPTSPRPIGTSIRDNPIPLLGLNCATCHTGTIRDTADGPARIVLGMPAHQLDVQAYLRFLLAAGQDPRFNADTLLPAIHADDPSFSVADDALFRYVVIPRTRQALIARAISFSWMDARPDFLPGRVDTFNPYKQRLETRFGPASGFNMATDSTVGTVALPSLWNQRPREGMWLHWDGNNDSVDERNKSAALGAGATEQSLDLASLARVHNFIADLQPPPFPRDRINADLARQGEQVWSAECASCHAFGGAKTGQVTPIDEIGTDPSRLDSFTPLLARNMSNYGKGYGWQFSHFVKTNGYANMPLDGIWLRAPYLHNGSVPTLRDLLNAPDVRPREFYTGYDLYDYTNVGFVSQGPEAQRFGERYDTSVAGNGNGGHLYGTNLSQAEKDALLEYMKTL